MEKLNVFNQPGCKLPNGKLCNICCKLFSISDYLQQFGVFRRQLVKKEGELCKYYSSGCTIRDIYPITCEHYFCGEEDIPDNEKKEIIETAYADGLIDQIDRESSLRSLEV